MEGLLWATVAVPAVAALAIRLAPRAAGVAAMVAAAAASVPALVLLVAAAGGERTRSAFAWLPAAPQLTVGLRLDGLSATMAATVALVGLVVVVYSTGYFAGDPRRRSALAGLLGFLAAMQGLVLADGYLALLFFWEIVGAFSARLIAFSRDDAEAPAGAVRAFLTTRSADLGLYLAVLALFAATGTLAFGGERPGGALGALVGLGLVVAAIGKSAQVPVQNWLAGAMRGPTPVSALLHSATMVAAGVYLLARSEALLEGWPLAVAGWVGAVTAVVGAAVALGEDDLKRLLAGSTASQLGLMFVGMAAGGPAVAIFHLVAHAAGKAGLFLATGVFQHRRDATALEDLRGSGRDDRPAFACFAVCAASIAAIPPFAAFWSKDHIAAAAKGQVGWFLLVLVAAAGSAAYLLRPALVLWGRAPEGAAPEAAAPVLRRDSRGRTAMLAGAGALALASVLLGLVGGPLARLLGEPGLPTSTLSLVLSLVAVAAGVAAVLVGRRPAEALVTAARRGFGVEAAQRLVAVRPALLAAHAAAVVDDAFIDRAVDGVGRGGLAAARAERRVEEHAVDAAVDGLAHLMARGGRANRRLQTGRLHEYLRDTVVGLAAVFLVVVVAAIA
jgi:NADH-quinone oxidoreductase subunit L